MRCEQPSGDPSSALVLRAVQGDRAAVGELLFNSTDELTKYISHRLSTTLRQSTSVEDILQETFAVAFRDIARFQTTENGTFMGWLKTIASHRIQDASKERHRKKRGGDRTQVRDVQAAAADSVLNLFDVLAQESETPLKRASRNEALQIMHIALAGLPENYREAVRLRYMEGMSYEAIAERFESTTGAVQGLLKRAKQRLRDALGTASAYLSSR